MRTAVTGESLKEFFYELDRIRDEKVAGEELQDAKNFLTGVFPLRAETQEGLTNLIVNQHLYGLPDDYLQTYREKVEAVTVDEVQKAAINYVRPGEMAIVIVGDAEEVLPQARTYADSVEIFDTEGLEQDVNKYVASPAVRNGECGGELETCGRFSGPTIARFVNARTRWRNRHRRSRNHAGKRKNCGRQGLRQQTRRDRKRRDAGSANRIYNRGQGRWRHDERNVDRPDRPRPAAIHRNTAETRPVESVFEVAINVL